MKTGSLLLALLLAGAPLGAQSSPEATPAAEHHTGCEEYAPDDNITPHITDGQGKRAYAAFKIGDGGERQQQRE